MFVFMLILIFGIICMMEVWGFLSVVFKFVNDFFEVIEMNKIFWLYFFSFFNIFLMIFGFMVKRMIFDFDVIFWLFLYVWMLVLVVNVCVFLKWLLEMNIFFFEIVFVFNKLLIIVCVIFFVLINFIFMLFFFLVLGYFFFFMIVSKE